MSRRAAMAGLACLGGLILLAGSAWAGDFFKAELAGRALTVELALDQESRALGLGGRLGLPEDQGLLFVYPERAERVFWNKGMLLAIDLLWLDRGRVVGLVERFRPPGRDGQTTSVVSPGPVDAVLEVRAGWADRAGLKPGDRLHLSPALKKRLAGLPLAD